MCLVQTHTFLWPKRFGLKTTQLVYCFCCFLDQPVQFTFKWRKRLNTFLLLFLNILHQRKIARIKTLWFWSVKQVYNVVIMLVEWYFLLVCLWEKYPHFRLLWPGRKLLCVCRCVYYELYNVSAAVFRRIEAEKSCLLDTAVRCTTPFLGCERSWAWKNVRREQKEGRTF